MSEEETKEITSLEKDLNKRIREWRHAAVEYKAEAASLVEAAREKLFLKLTSRNVFSGKDPKALQFADLLESQNGRSKINVWLVAAELRRLHALCEEMGEALGNAHSELKSLACAPDSAYAKPDRECIYEIEVALDKWKESK